MMQYTAMNGPYFVSAEFVGSYEPTLSVKIGIRATAYYHIFLDENSIRGLKEFLFTSGSPTDYVFRTNYVFDAGFDVELTQHMEVSVVRSSSGDPILLVELGDDKGSMTMAMEPEDIEELIEYLSILKD